MDAVEQSIPTESDKERKVIGRHHSSVTRQTTTRCRPTWPQGIENWLSILRPISGTKAIRDFACQSGREASIPPISTDMTHPVSHSMSSPVSGTGTHSHLGRTYFQKDRWHRVLAQRSHLRYSVWRRREIKCQSKAWGGKMVMSFLGLERCWVYYETGRRMAVVHSEVVVGQQQHRWRCEAEGLYLLLGGNYPKPSALGGVTLFCSWFYKKLLSMILVGWFNTETLCVCWMTYSRETAFPLIYWYCVVVTERPSLHLLCVPGLLHGHPVKHMPLTQQCSAVCKWVKVSWWLCCHIGK